MLYLVKNAIIRKDAWPKIDKLKNSSIGRRFISQLQSAEFKVSCTVVGSVRYVHKLAIRNVCFGCQSQVKNGVCSYVGCCWAGEPRTKLDLKAWYIRTWFALLSVNLNKQFPGAGAPLKTVLAKHCSSLEVKAASAGSTFRRVYGMYSKSKFCHTKANLSTFR